MKGYVAVDIPTKKYIKAYIEHRVGPAFKLRRGNPVADKLYDLLQHDTNQKKMEFRKTYNTKLRVYIGIDLYYRRGCNLNQNNLKNFNLFVEGLIKDKFYTLMDHYIESLPNFSAHLSQVRKKLGIDIDAWDDDSMRKDYYRYRKKIIYRRYI